MENDFRLLKNSNQIPERYTLGWASMLVDVWFTLYDNIHWHRLYIILFFFSKKILRPQSYKKNFILISAEHEIFANNFLLIFLLINMRHFHLD